MDAICFSAPIPMKFCVHSIIIEKVHIGKLGFNNLSNNKNRPIVCMAAIRNIGPIRLVPTYIQRAEIKSMCVKLYKDST